MITTPLTLIYLTCRARPHLAWFFSSLMAQRAEIPEADIRVIVIDSMALAPAGVPGSFDVMILHPPKPCVWQGPHRLTQEDWFAAGSARNTGLCLAKTEWVAFIDDLTVLTPGWLAAALEATGHPNTITCGAYQKVKELVVSSAGKVVSFTGFDAGHDNRWRHLDPTFTVQKIWPAGGSWLYGCSLVAPVEAFLQINGWCEDLAGGLGFEDCLTGIVLENAGVKFRYDTRLLTLESEEDHHAGKPFRKTDKGVSPDDKSHEALACARNQKRFSNHFDLRAIRAAVQRGEPFPIPTEPTVDWYDQQPLKDMT